MFLQRSATAVAGGLLSQTAFSKTTELVLGAEDSRPLTASVKSGPELRVMLHEKDGKPLVHERATNLHARDLANDPLPLAIHSATGRARVELATEPIQLSCRLKVPGFGEVFCYADNNGEGYAKPDTIEFIVEAAATRLHRVRNAAKHAAQAGVPDNAEIERHLEAAAQKIPAKPESARIAAAYESLAHGLHAGEKLTLRIARHRISKFSAPRNDFLFGASTAGREHGGNFVKHFLEAFNFGTLGWYTWGQKSEPPDKRIDYTRMDDSLQWCLNLKLVPRGFGYVYMAPGAMAKWFRAWPYKKVLAQYKQIVATTTRRYDGRLQFVEVINEAHDKANIFDFSHAQILELTREACRAARNGSPTVKRIINNCCLWAEYAKHKNDDGSRRWSPYRYLKDCVSAEVEFDIIGLQMYYPMQDLFEISKMFDRFASFKKPIFITEIACNSAEGLDPACMGPTRSVAGWHGAWNETMQADWLEAIYTICYSRPEFCGVGWWDFADYGGHFWPFGGLLRKDSSPKESFLRLLKLQEAWGVQKSSIEKT